MDLGMFYEQTLKNMTVRGIPGAEYTKIIQLPGKPKCIETSLANLKVLFEYEIHRNKVYTNDIHEVAKTLGIEAARTTIIKEIRLILSFYGIYVNVRHILILVDWMTSTGSLMPLTRHGIRNVDASPLKRATFEEVADVFNQAACFNEKDDLDGISECIIAGVPPKVGTKVADCILDKVVEREHAIPRPAPPLLVFEAQDDEKDIYGEDEPWIKMDDAPYVDPFVGGQGGFNANTFGTMGGMMGAPPMMVPPTNVFNQPTNVFNQPTNVFSQPTNVFSQPTNVFGQMPPAQPSFYNPMMNKPPSPVYTVPKSPVYDPFNPTMERPVSPMSPAYDPNGPDVEMYDPNAPKSPEYDPFKPTAHRPVSPMSPQYSPTDPQWNGQAYDPSSTSMVASPTSPVYSPTSPAYSPPGSPMSPVYDIEHQGPQAPVYDPCDPIQSPRIGRKRKTFLE